MDQQTEWPATPLHFLYNNTILWCIHAPQANPPPSLGKRQRELLPLLPAS